MNQSKMPDKAIDALENAALSSLDSSLKRYREEQLRGWRSPLRVVREGHDYQWVQAMCDRTAAALIALEAERVRP